jgi:hydroxymethylpyrimidine pyrophosphatase-like HAD family hydrolase
MALQIGFQPGRITEFFAQGTSKWQAFLGLFPEAAAQSERVIAIGDEANDLEMIRAAGLGIAMGNAIPAVQAAARYVTADLDHEGVALALEAVLRS